MKGFARARFLLVCLWFLACVFMVVLWGHEIVSVKMRPEEYAYLWGGEGPVAGIWYYASETAYLLHLGLLVLWFLAGIALCLGRGPFNRPKLLLAHALISGLWLAATLSGYRW